MHLEPTKNPEITPDVLFLYRKDKKISFKNEFLPNFNYHWKNLASNQGEVNIPKNLQIYLSSKKTYQVTSHIHP